MNWDPFVQIWTWQMNKKNDRIHNSNMCLTWCYSLPSRCEQSVTIYSGTEYMKYGVSFDVRPSRAAAVLRLQRLAHVNCIDFTMQKPWKMHKPDRFRLYLLQVSGFFSGFIVREKLSRSELFLANGNFAYNQINWLFTLPWKRCVSRQWRSMMQYSIFNIRV